LINRRLIAHRNVEITLTALFLLVSSLTSASAFAASDYPARPIRLIVPFAPGGGADISGRTIATKLSDRLQQHVVVDNRPGAELVAKANPDGYTLLLASSSYGANPSLYKLSYDPVSGFEAITLVSQQPFIFVINPAVPAKSVKELITYAKSNPGKLNYISSGAGGIQHLAVELFKSMAAIDIVHIPYRGGSSAQTDLIANQVQVEFGTMLSTLPLVKSGQLRALAVTTAVRSAALPDIPALTEAVPGYAVSGWYAVFAPAGTPRDVVTILNREIVGLLQAPDVRQRLANEGSMVVASTPQELREHVRQEVGKWKKLVAETNIKLEASR
jgi:tripartite-type tricarboxylate transporter receptor subunit TctC